MKTTQARALLDRDGLLARGQHPELASAIDTLTARGEITRLLPGIHVPAGETPSCSVLARAVALWHPRAVVTGAAAAHLMFAPSLVVGEVPVALRHARALPAPFRLHRFTLPPEAIADDGRYRLSTPAVAAVWESAHDGGELVDTALRLGAATPSQIEEALHLLGKRVGNGARRPVVELTSTNPWSTAERLAHRLLRESGITGWKANAWFELEGMRFPVDIVFARQRLVIEVDSLRFHTGREVFELDRRKTNALVRAGWTVVRVTWAQLEEPGYFVGLVRDLLARQA